jgi:hypothetical protein
LGGKATQKKWQQNSLAGRGQIMPLTDFQKALARLLAKNRSPDSHLAGGAALHFQPDSIRYSNDLDYFHDSVERVASAFAADRDDLETHGYHMTVEIKQPGYIKGKVFTDKGATKVEWAHDSDWRFMPTVHDENYGYVMHPVDLAINKVLTLAGRNEPRDFIDVMHVHTTTLPLGALCWAATGKDPGFTPLSLLDLLRRRGRYQEADFNRLKFNQALDLKKMKIQWLLILDEAEAFIESRPANELGCLYYSQITQGFFAPQGSEDVYQLHFGRPGGILPRIVD